MKNANISELKNHLSRFLAYVRRGGTVRVFDRDRPVADLTPCRTPTGAGEETIDLAALEREGIVRRGTGELPADFLTRKLPKPKASVIDALIEERRGGR